MIRKRSGSIGVVTIICILITAFAFAAERASFGVMIKAVTAEYAQFIGLETPVGAYVVSTPATGDLRPGDVVLKVDDRIIKAPADLQEVARLHQPGDQVQLQIARGKERLHRVWFVRASPPGLRPWQDLYLPLKVHALNRRY
jgi:hypothetical protein